MPYPHLAKSLLALAIASTSLQSHAVINDIGNGPLEYESQTISESLIITGSLTTEEDAVELADGTQLQGDLILDAQITVNGPQAEAGNFASAVDISGDGWGEAVQIDGQVINKGSLNASGLMAQGITVQYADIEGGVVNDGSIIITNGIDLPDDQNNGATDPTGIFVSNANIDNHLLNSGLIDVSGNETFGGNHSGLWVVESDLAEAEVVNTASGRIQVKGADAAGIDFSLSDIKSLENAGQIVVEGSQEATGIFLEDSEVFGDILNSGLINATGTDDATGIKLENTPLNNLANSGQIVVTSPAGEAVGIQVDYSNIDGALTNLGDISVQGGGEAIGIELFDSSIENLINNGTITVVNANGGPVNASSEADTRGVLLFGSEADGEVRNNGTIKVSGNKVAGIQILNSDLSAADIINTGTIDASGAIAFGIDLSGIDPAVVQTIDNSGTIKVNASERSHGLYIDHVVASGRLNNSGSIIATGADSRAIRLEQADIAEGIHNSGTIKGGDYGIWVGDNDVAPVHITQTAGLIEGGQFAIQGGSGNEVSLELAGGTITGNIAGVFKVDVTGKSTFDGELISTAFQGDVGKGWIDLYNSSDSPNGKAGHLVLVRPHVTLDGDLEMNSGSTLELNLSQATNANQAIVNVTGEAYFASDSRLLLTPVGNDFTADGKHYILLAANSIDDEGLNVASSSALLNVDLFDVDGTQVHATVTRKAAGEAEDILNEGGASSNGQAAFTPFFSTVLSQLDSSDPVFQAFANADASELARLAEQFTPQVDGAASQAATGAQGLISGAVGSRTSSLRGASSGSPFSQTGVWLQALSSSADQGRRDGIAGYDADSKGLSIGIDGKLADNLTLGLAYSNLTTDVKSDGGNKTDVDSHALTLYSGLEHGNLFVDASLTYGVNDNSSKRYIAGTQAKGDYDSSLLGLNLTAGYGLHFGNLTLEPRVAGRYSRVDIDGFTEKGSSAALRQDSQRYEVIELGAGARLAGLFQAGQGTLEPELRLMAYHDFAADQARSTSSYVLGGTPFVTSGAKPARDSYEAGIGLNYRIGAFTLGGSYERIGKTDFDADVIQAKVRYDF